MDKMPGVGEGAVAFPARCFEKLGEHFDGALGENEAVAFVRLDKQVLSHSAQFVLAFPASKRIKPVADTPGIKHEDIAHAAFEACGLLVQIRLDVVHDEGSAPAEDLGFGQQSLAAPRFGFRGAEMTASRST